MSTLYIIGNGFDLFNGLKTKYSDFHQYVINHFPELENKIEDYFLFETERSYLWKNFEHDLSTFNYMNLLEEHNHIDVLSDSFKPSELFGLEDEISEAVDSLVEETKSAFTEWINEIQYPDKAMHLFDFPENALFIIFNYTDTLENLYNVKKSQILYIHNNANDSYGELIFGHGISDEPNPKPDDFDDFGEPTRTMFTDSENASRYPFYAFMKNTNEVLIEHAAFFDSLHAISEITVLGHSLGKADWPYFKTINRIIPDADWKVSFYSDEEHNLLYSIANEGFGIAVDKIKMIRLEDEIS